MKRWLSQLLPLTFLCAQESAPEDQLLVIFGSSGYIIYKVLDFANDHGFRYVKVLSFRFSAFDHEISGSYQGEKKPEGRYFELKDSHAFISFLCLDEKPSDDPHIIDLEKYQSLIHQIHSVEESPDTHRKK